VRRAIRKRWSKRELERQFKAALFERVVLSPPKVSAVVTQMYPESEPPFEKCRHFLKLTARRGFPIYRPIDGTSENGPRDRVRVSIVIEAAF
jgi:hypothetical protein